jgi:hypothetical protein
METDQLDLLGRANRTHQGTKRLTGPQAHLRLAAKQYLLHVQAAK